MHIPNKLQRGSGMHSAAIVSQSPGHHSALKHNQIEFVGR